MCCNLSHKHCQEMWYGSEFSTVATRLVKLQPSNCRFDTGIGNFIWPKDTGLSFLILSRDLCRVPVRVSHVAIGESSKELAKSNLRILAKSINSSN